MREILSEVRERERKIPELEQAIHTHSSFSRYFIQNIYKPCGGRRLVLNEMKSRKSIKRALSAASLEIDK